MTKREFVKSLKINDMVMMPAKSPVNSRIFKVTEICQGYIAYQYVYENYTYVSHWYWRNEDLSTQVDWHIMTPEESVAFVLEN